MKTIEMERENSVKKIDELMKSVPGKVTRVCIENEILSASKLQESSTSNHAETGSTGKYAYSFRDSLMAGNRSYIRKRIASPAGDEEQTVFSHNFHLEQLGSMSLSVDEAYAVRLITHTGDGMKQRMVIRHIDSGVEHDIDFGQAFEGDNGTAFGRTSRTRIHSVEFGSKLAESNGNLHTLFFTSCDELGRPDAVYGCVIFGGERGKEKRIHSTPELILRDNDAAHFVDVQRTKGCDYVAIHSSSKTCNEIHLLGKELVPILVRKRQAGVRYFVDCGVDDDIVIMAHTASTDINEPPDVPEYLVQEFSVFEDNIRNLPLEGTFGIKIIATSDTNVTNSGYFIEDIELFETSIVLQERSFADGTQRLRTIDRQGGHINNTDVPLGGIGIEKASRLISSSGNMNYYAPYFQFNVESPVIPPIDVQYDFKRNNILCLKRFKNTTTDGLNKSHYKNKRVLVDVDDGATCPLTIVYNESSKVLSGRRPVLLVGYGCYGQNQNLGYDPTIIPLIERGFAVAYCHGRGGRERGQQWYEDGSRLKKINAVKDFLACAQYLSSKDSILQECVNGEVDTNHQSTFIAAKAFSAGGVVVGASLNERPELFQVVSFRNAFIDVLGTMSNPSLYLTEHEWDEFGNPQDEAAKASISSYCPFTNVKRQRYPPILLVGAIDDESVPFYHAMMFGHKVRDFCDGDNTSVLINIQEEGGHHLHGRSLEVAALEVSHILGQFGRWCDDVSK